jgi:hypothetical protein
MKRLIILTCILLVGCVDEEWEPPPPYVASHPEIACVDDSKTSAGWSWCHCAGFSYHAQAGLSIDQVKAFPKGKEVILMGLGINTAYKAPLFSADTWLTKFLELKAEVPDTHIMCLIADVAPFSSVPEHHSTFEEIKDYKKTYCDSWIYYDDWGYHHSTPDGVHGTKKDVNNACVSASIWYDYR